MQSVLTSVQIMMLLMKTGSNVGSVANPLLQFIQSDSGIYSNDFAEGDSSDRRDLERSGSEV